MTRFRKKWLRNKWISDEGYTLEFTDGTRAPRLKHVEGREVVLVPTELLVTKGVGFAVFVDQMRYGGARGKSVTDEVVRGRVARHVQALFSELGWTLDLAS